jgi:hypothetical protein
MSPLAHRPLRLAAAAGLSALALAASPAFAASPARTAPRRPARPPAWARHEPGPCPRPFPRTHLCAVGKAEGAPSDAGRQAAVTRARRALAAALQQARGGTTPGGDGEPAPETLEGSEVLAVQRTRDGTWYALAAIEAPPAGASQPR